MRKIGVYSSRLKPVRSDPATVMSSSSFRAHFQSLRSIGSMEEPTSNEEETTVRVAVRCRPFNSKEKANGETSCVKIYSDQVVLVNPANSSEEHSFAFDMVIDENSTQESVWVNVGVPILNKAFSGYNGTIFAYGQTGSGKTWSMQGAEGNDLEGIIPRMNSQLFERVESELKKRQTVQFLITVSYFEIYNEVIFDLLDSSDRKKRSGKGGLEIKEHPVLGVYVKGLQEVVVDSAAKLQSFIDQGMRNRTVASTQMNADSSRSHSVFIINLHQKDVEDESKNVFAKVNLVDLAGSERVKSTGATGSILKEGANINKSLSALGNVINALVEVSKGKGGFIPYRNSKLTRVLQESLGGNSVTAMLAALSPAACNFEETLSTLKYANRAKAIKVKAVKNEQSSQISKLNDEIRALKEKLLSQGGAGGGAGGGAQDSSALDDKNRQRLRDLEDAMRSTWEAKSKMSEEHERDRQALLLEQQNAARQFEAARQRNWALLEQKADLEITLSHVRTLVADRLLHTPVGVLLAQWMEALKEVAALERRLAEQDTVVQVYRGSLDKDCKALVQQQSQSMKGGTQVVFDSTAFSLLRQLKEKVSVTTKELHKWMGLQDQLLEKVARIIKEIRDAGSARSILAQTSAALASVQPQTDAATPGALTKDERKEISKGLGLIRRQTVSKHRQSNQSVANSRKDFVAFESVRLDFVKLLSIYDSSTSHEAGLQPPGAAESDPAALDIIQSVSAQAKAMRDKLERGAVTLVEVFDRLEKAQQMTHELAHSRSTSRVGDANSNGNASPVPEALGEIVPLDGVSIRNFDPELVYNPRAAAMHRQSSSKLEMANSSSTASVIGVDSPQSWACPLSRARGKDSSLVLELPGTQFVTSLQLQGGQIAPEKSAESLTSSASTPALAPPRALSGAELLASMTLPCGLTLATVEPQHELTSAALADVFDWTALIKSNAPEKFLKRPPVRFLFDMIKFIGTNNLGFLDESLESADWAVVGADKNSKLDFMEKMIQFITKSVFAAEPTTTASAIVTGSDPELTNALLQQLAIALFAFQNKLLDITSTAAMPAPGARAAAAPTPAKIVAHEAWVVVLRVEHSLDGEQWKVLGEVPTGLRAANQVANVPFQAGSGRSGGPGTLSASTSASSLAPLKCRYLRLTPVKWNGEGKFGPAMRLSVLGPEALSDEEQEDPAEAAGVVPLQAGAVGEVVGALLGTLAVLIEAAEFVSRKEEAAKELKQLEVKRNLENLAKDKQALEAMMANEKKSLENDNQDLAERLKTAFNQLKETQGLLEKERLINTQLEAHRSDTEKEKSAMQKSLLDKEEENAQLKATILSLQASFEKERAQCEALQGKLTESEQAVETLQDQLTQAEEARAASEHEREELLSQISILTEERDGARAQEEELFEKLSERTNDLDQLRDSYVDVTDKWNDAQDEVMDLRDKIESLQNAMETRSFLHTASPAVSYQQPPFFSKPAPAVVPAEPKTAPVPAVASGQESPRSAGSKAAKAVPPAGEQRGAKVSPRGASGAHHYVSPGGSHDGSLLQADGKTPSQALPFSGSSPPGRESKPSTTAGGISESPSKPPPAPLRPAGASEYGDEYFDDYEEEFEAED